MSVIRFPGGERPEDEERRDRRPGGEPQDYDEARRWRKSRIAVFDDPEGRAQRRSGAPLPEEQTGARRGGERTEPIAHDSVADIVRRSRLIEEFSGVATDSSELLMGDVDPEERARIARRSRLVDSFAGERGVDIEPGDLDDYDADGRKHRAEKNEAAPKKARREREGGSVFDSIPVSSGAPLPEFPRYVEPELRERDFYGDEPEMQPTRTRVFRSEDDGTETIPGGRIERMLTEAVAAAAMEAGIAPNGAEVPDEPAPEPPVEPRSEDDETAEVLRDMLYGQESPEEARERALDMTEAAFDNAEPQPQELAPAFARLQAEEDARRIGAEADEDDVYYYAEEGVLQSDEVRALMRESLAAQAAGAAAAQTAVSGTDAVERVFDEAEEEARRRYYYGEPADDTAEEAEEMPEAEEDYADDGSADDTFGDVEPQVSPLDAMLEAASAYEAAKVIPAPVAAIFDEVERMSEPTGEYVQEENEYAEEPAERDYYDAPQGEAEPGEQELCEDTGQEYIGEAAEQDYYDEEMPEYAGEPQDYDDDVQQSARQAAMDKRQRRESYLSEYALDGSDFVRNDPEPEYEEEEPEDDVRRETAREAGYIGGRRGAGFGAGFVGGFIGQHRGKSADKDKTTGFTPVKPVRPAMAPLDLVRSKASEAAREIVGMRAKAQGQAQAQSGERPQPRRVSPGRPAVTQKPRGPRTVSAPQKPDSHADRRSAGRPQSRQPRREKPITRAEVKLMKDGTLPLTTRLRKWITGILVLAAVLLVSYYALAAILLQDVNVVKSDAKWSDAPVSAMAGTELRHASNVKNILLLGIDDDGSKGSRSDTIMIASVNTRTHKVKLCSILRDCYVEIPDHQQTKINAAYAYGGADLAVRTVEANFRVDIDDYVSTDMSSMIAVVEAVGGVTIELTAKEAEQVNKHSQSPFVAREGVNRLDGRQAVQYSQIRKIDSDFARTSRQRVLINAIVKQCKSLPVSELPGVVKAVAPRLTTDMGSARIATTALEVLPALSNDIEQMTIPAEGTYSFKNIGGASCVVLDVEKNAQLLQEYLYGD